MKNVKLISLALSMLISFVLKAQEQTPDKQNSSVETAAIPPKTFTKSKDTISVAKVALNPVQPVTTNQIRICAPSRSVLKEPLYVLDGVIINSKQFSKLNPNAIKEIKILKDPNGTSLYGCRAINGVVIITTKEKE
ncbi:TonB-dependent receptor plug domain-containing protein [Flavobacterium pectinovorum]|uniref:TonB-dependent receptor plug domain-containing protein n=1 Tax=Flavobacterium pectinovorum TaxID=29533 RepID=UPI001FAC2325|nr:TonB-dependent receptor plug domain-containing protein [Flavobacterium pectinovorum]MCI9846321.1 TonB-dependent receptor plug domain-containing protein [Flavobacterium pectinovorum]